MRDFTPETYKLLLKSLMDQNYSFFPFVDFLQNPETKSIVLRHDVDGRKMNSLRTAILENELGIKGTYYFRMVPESFDKDVIKKIAGWGHEIGYHYEDVSLMAQRLNGAKAQWFNKSGDEKNIVDAAFISFKENLEKLRRIVPVDTICMHGSPLSRWDNRLLWKYYDYGDLGILGEPYFDIDFEKVLYLTDTGRRWDGGAVTVRDKVTGRKGRREEDTEGRRDRKKGEEDEERRRRGDGEMRGGRNKGIGGDKEKGKEGEKGYRNNTILHSPFPPLPHSLLNRFHSTFDIIGAARENRLPDQILLTVHPQRWDDRAFPWIKELFWQNVKNMVKRAVVKIRKNEW